MDGTQSFPEIVKLLIENGLQSTLILFFLTLIFGLILGMIIAKGRMSKLLIIQMPIRFFLLIMRGTPLILQLYGFYFGLYYIAGLSLDRMTAAVIGFSLNYAAYFAEIYRSGIQAIPKGQYEAAKVLGFNKTQTFFKIILPQVVKIITPSLGSECMTLVKDTSLAHVIGVMEIYVVATNQMARSRGMIYLVVAGIFYLIMNAKRVFDEMLSEDGDLSSALSSSTTEAKKTTESSSSSKNISIEIQNSTSISGLAGRWKDKLSSDGYTVGSVKTYREGSLTHTKIIVEDKSLGQDLKSYFKNPEYTVGTVSSGARICIIVGTEDEI